MTNEDLIALIKKQPVAFLCGFVILASGLTLYFRSEAVDQAASEAQEKEKEFKKIDLNVRSTAGLPEATSEIQAAAKQFEARLVRAPQLANNLQIFYRLETETGLKLLDARQLPVPALRGGEKRGAYVPVPFQVTVQGTYAQVHEFLRRLENGPHFQRLNQVTITKFSAGGDTSFATSGALNANINLELLGTP